MSDSVEEAGWATAKTLAEALPYIQRYDRETVVIKYGGHAMGESAVARQFAADVVLLKLMGVNPVVVHGGGPQISAMLDKAGVKSSFVDGLRVTDPATMEVAELVFDVHEGLVVDPTEERLRDEFGNTKVLHLPMQSIIRVEEVERKGQSAIRDAATGEKVVTPFPMPAKPR